VRGACAETIAHALDCFHDAIVMRVSIEQLAGVLAKSLPPVWLIAGD
jgi:hypothetical protein